MVVAQLPDDRGQREPVDGRGVGRNRAKRRADTGVLAKDIDAKASTLGRHIGEIEIVALREMLGLRFRQNLGHVTLELGIAQFAELDR